MVWAWRSDGRGTFWAKLISEFESNDDHERHAAFASRHGVRLTTFRTWLPTRRTPIEADRGRILVVDDKENMRRLLRDILIPRHDVALAADGLAARTQLESQRFEVVLTDVRMPGLDGLALVRLVKERWPATEIVVMTAFASIPAAVEACGTDLTTTSRTV